MSLAMCAARPLWAAALLPALSGILPAESIRTFAASIEPAIVENRVQGPPEYAHAVSPSGWLVDCHGFAAGRANGISQDWTLHRWKFEGARLICPSTPAQPDGAYEHFYFGREPGRTAEMLPRYREIHFRDAWPGVDVRYSLLNGSLILTLEATIAGAFSQVRFSNDPVHPLTLHPPSATESRRSYTLGPLPGLADPGAIASDADGSLLVVSADRSWPRLDSGTAGCKIEGEFDKCHGVAVHALHPDGRLRSISWIRGTRYQNARHAGVDQGGNFYVAGQTFSRDFPVTPGKLQTEYAGPNEMPAISRGVQPGGDVFVAKFHGPTGLLIHSTLIGGPVSEFVESFSIDRGGRAYIGVSEQRLLMGSPPLALQVLNEDATMLEYIAPPSLVQVYSVSSEGEVAAIESVSGMEPALTLLDRQGQRTLDRLRVPGNRPGRSVVRAEDGAIWVLTGNVDGVNSLYRLPVGENAFQTVEPEMPAGSLRAEGGAVVFASLGEPRPLPDRLRPTPSALLAEPCPSSPLAIRFDTAGGVIQSTYLPPVSIASSQSHFPLSWLHANPAGSVARLLDWASPRQPFLACVFAPASRHAAAPGSLLRLQGFGLGPATPIDLPLDMEGRLATEVQGIKVTIDGLAMPILSAAPGVVDVVVPQAAEPSRFPMPSVIRVESLDPAAGGAGVPIAATAPQSLEGYRGLLIRNENGSANSANNPSGAGETVTVALGGAGKLDPAPPEGALTYPQPPKVVHAITATLNGVEAEVMDAVQIEGLPPGMVRARIRMPRLPNLSPGSYAFDLSIIMQGQQYLAEPIRLHYRLP